MKKFEKYDIALLLVPNGNFPHNTEEIPQFSKS